MSFYRFPMILILSICISSFIDSCVCVDVFHFPYDNDNAGHDDENDDGEDDDYDDAGNEDAGDDGAGGHAGGDDDDVVGSNS